MATFTPSSTSFQGYARWLSVYNGRACMAYSKKYREEPSTQAYLSPFILERRFREEIEVFHEPFDGIEKWFLAESTIHSLTDALEQVRDCVGRYCGTMDHIFTYGPDSPLYSRLRDCGILYPSEPENVLNPIWWQAQRFNSLELLHTEVCHAQLWGQWMIHALYCLGIYDGLDVRKDMDKLPPCSLYHLCRAQATLASSPTDLADFQQDLINARVTSYSIPSLKEYLAVYTCPSPPPTSPVHSNSSSCPSLSRWDEIEDLDWEPCKEEPMIEDSTLLVPDQVLYPSSFASNDLSSHGIYGSSSRGSSIYDSE
jgi:hypothetical protein